MSTAMRFSPAALFGMPPLAGLFGKRNVARKEPVMSFARPEPAAPPSAEIRPAPVSQPLPDGVDMNKLLRAAKVSPDLPMLEWDGDVADSLKPANDADIPLLPEEANDDPHAFEPRRRKIRDRYITARFPGVARSSGDLTNAQAMVKAARLMFEEEQADLALELLQLALGEAPQESALWLARLEILFLTRDREGFVATARAFRNAHRSHEAWSEVERLGRALAPGEALFGATSGPREHEHYGPWPHLPNWIQAPWDLTAEIVAADFHRAVTRLAPRLAATGTGD
jgi:hypothetical protein